MNPTINIALFLLLYAFYSQSQNLVPNASLEQHSNCPNAIAQISYSTGWFAACKPSCSPQSGYAYFNGCGTQCCGVPYNSYGYQNALNGIAYAGITVYNINVSNGRGFIETKLNSTLTQNKKYCVGFYVSQVELSGFSVNKIGCLFTPDSFLIDSITQPIFLTPQIENTQGVIYDTMNWVLISGQFIANGGEQFLTIGNFRNDSNTNVVVNSFGGSSSSIYYIDDVSVTLCDTVGINELQISDYRLQIYPNPSNGTVTITATGGDKIVVTDITGRKIKTMQITTSNLTINNNEFSNGIYYLSLYRGELFVATKKFIVAK